MADDEFFKLMAIDLSDDHDKRSQTKPQPDRTWVGDLMIEVNRLLDGLLDSNLNLKEHVRSLESIAGTLDSREHRIKIMYENCFLPLESCEVQQVIELALNVFDRDKVESAETANSLRLSAKKMLSVLLHMLNSDQTKLVYDFMISRVKTDPEDKNYCQDLVRKSAICLAGLRFEQVLTEDEAFALHQQLIPLAAKTFHLHSHPWKSVELFNERRYYRRSEIGIMGLLLELQRFVGHGRYRKYVYSTVRANETNGLAADDLAAIFALALELLPDFTDRFGRAQKKFVKWLLHLVDHNGAPFRAHLVYIIYHFIYQDNTQYCLLDRISTDLFCEQVAERLLRNLLSRDDDLMGDNLIVDFIHQCRDCNFLRGSVNVLRYFSDEEELAIREKLKRLNSNPEFAKLAMKRDFFYTLAYFPYALLAESLIGRIKWAQAESCEISDKCGHRNV